MAKEEFGRVLEKVDDCCYRIPKSYKPGMRVDGLIFVDDNLLGQIKLDQAPEQVANVALLPCFDLGESTKESTTACRWFAQKPHSPVLRVVTESGIDVEATADHPFWTPDGMIPLGKLKAGDRVAVHPFQGVPYEAPSDE